MSNSDLRRSLLGIWRLVSVHIDVDGELVKPCGNDPQGYLVYMPDGHMFVQSATRGERSWPTADVFKLPPPQFLVAHGFLAYAGTFEVRDGQVIHHREFGSLSRMSGTVKARSVTLDGDRLVLSPA